MKTANESIEYLENMCASGDPDQLIPTSHLKMVLAELARRNEHIATQSELLTCYRNQLSKAYL